MPGLFTVFFSGEPVRDYEGAKAADAERYAAFCRAMLDRGIYPPASQFEAWFPSLAHTADHVERTVAAAREAFATLVSALRDGRRRVRPGAARVRAGRAARARIRRLRARRRPRGLRDALRHAARPSTAWTTTCGCWPATRSTRWASTRLAQTGDLAAVAELADLISACAQAHAESRPEQAEGRWADAAKKLAPGR